MTTYPRGLVLLKQFERSRESHLPRGEHTLEESVARAHGEVLSQIKELQLRDGVNDDEQQHKTSGNLDEGNARMVRQIHSSIVLTRGAKGMVVTSSVRVVTSSVTVVTSSVKVVTSSVTVVTSSPSARRSTELL